MLMPRGRDGFPSASMYGGTSCSTRDKAPVKLNCRWSCRTDEQPPERLASSWTWDVSAEQRGVRPVSPGLPRAIVGDVAPADEAVAAEGGHPSSVSVARLTSPPSRMTVPIPRSSSVRWPRS